jgi:hypothetical protein
MVRNHVADKHRSRTEVWSQVIHSSGRGCGHVNACAVCMGVCTLVEGLVWEVEFA